MIDSRTQQAAAEFQQTWGERFSPVPRLALDWTWPSIGIVDRMLHRLRFLKDRSPADERLLEGATAYLATMIEGVWSEFCSSVHVTWTQEDGISITAQGGRLMQPGEKFQLKLLQTLSVLLTEPPSPLPILGDFTRPIEDHYNMLSLLSTGFFTGVTPYGVGAWKQAAFEDFQPQVETATRALAKQCAKHYGEVFTKEPLGQVAELYLNNLVLPPTLMGEPLPALEAVGGILQFMKQFSLKPQQINELAYNLALSPDERLSLAGLSVYVATLAGEPEPEALAVAEEKGNFMGVLRNSVLLVQQELGLGDDWLRSEKFGAQEKQRFLLERNMGMLPWVQLPVSRIGDKVLRPIVWALSRFEYEQALKLLIDYISENPHDIDARKQQVFLGMLVGEIEESESLLRAILTEPGSEDDPEVLAELAVCCMVREKMDEALGYFSRAFSSERKSWKTSEIANNYAWALLSVEKFEQSLEATEVGLEQASHRVSALLNRAYALRMLSRHDEAEIVDQTLLMLAPNDYRVLGNYMLPFLSVSN